VDLSGVNLSEQEPAQYRVHRDPIGSEYFHSLKEAKKYIEEEIRDLFTVVRCIEWSMGEDTEIPYVITGVKIKLSKKTK